MTERRRIHAVSIRDFRGITALDLDFTDGTGAPLDVVVLAGANGCGKTSVLEAILLALGYTGYFDFSGNRLHEQMRFGQKVAILRAHCDDVVHEVRIGDSGTRIHTSVHSNNVLTHEFFSADRVLRPLPPTDGSHEHRFDESLRLEELTKRLISAYYRGLRSRLREPSSLFARLQNMWRRFDPNDRQIEVIPLDNNPGSGDIVVLRDGPTVPEDITSLAMARKASLSRSDIPSMVPLNALSSGQRALFAFAGPLIFRDEPADIVLIDEPEQHMHVQWQRLLLPALRELCPDTQFIVATHSEEILDSVLSYERFILVDDDDPRAHIVEPGAAAE